MSGLEERANVEQIARALAASAGVIWDQMEKYPGYARGIWLNKARLLVNHMSVQTGEAA
jgi:hypothetical protein